MSNKEIFQALKSFCDKIEFMVENEKEILIVSHLDADGIASASIIASALARLGARCAVRYCFRYDLEYSTSDAL